MAAILSHHHSATDLETLGDEMTLCPQKSRVSLHLFLSFSKALVLFCFVFYSFLSPQTYPEFFSAHSIFLHLSLSLFWIGLAPLHTCISCFLFHFTLASFFLISLLLYRPFSFCHSVFDLYSHTHTHRGDNQPEPC